MPKIHNNFKRKLKKVLNVQNRQDRGKKNVNKNLQRNRENGLLIQCKKTPLWRQDGSWMMFLLFGQ